MWARVWVRVRAKARVIGEGEGEGDAQRRRGASIFSGAQKVQLAHPGRRSWAPALPDLT